MSPVSGNDLLSLAVPEYEEHNNKSDKPSASSPGSSHSSSNVSLKSPKVRSTPVPPLNPADDPKSCHDESGINPEDHSDRTSTSSEDSVEVGIVKGKNRDDGETGGKLSVRDDKNNESADSESGDDKDDGSNADNNPGADADADADTDTGSDTDAESNTDSPSSSAPAYETKALIDSTPKAPPKAVNRKLTAAEKNKMKCLKKLRKRQAEQVGGQKIQRLYEDWQSEVDLKRELIKKGEFENAARSKKMLKDIRFELVREIEKKFSAQNLNKTLRRFNDTEKMCRASEWCGRLIITVHEGDNVIGKDKRTNAFVSFQLGDCQKRTETVKNATLSPDFADEQIHFDVLDGNKLCEDNDLNLKVLLYDDNYISDSLLGTCNIKLKHFIQNPNVKESSYHQLHVYKFRKGYTNTAKLKISLIYHQAHPGLALFTLIDGRNLANRGGLFDEQDPFVTIKINNKQSKRSRTVDDGGINPNFNNEQIIMKCTEQSFQHDVEVQVRDDDLIGSDLIGKCTFSLLPYLTNSVKNRNRRKKINKKGSTENANGPEIETFTLMHRNKLCGSLRMSVQFLPAGSLTVEIIKARNLTNPDYAGKPDPYCILAMESIESSFRQQHRTPVHNSTLDPVWNHTVCFDIVDQIEISLKVYDDDFGLDDLIGKTSINIVPTIRDTNYSYEWYPIYLKNGRKKTGEILLKLSFDPYSKIRYPQYRETLDGSDDILPAKITRKTPMTSQKLQAKLSAQPSSKFPLNPQHIKGRLHLTFDHAENVQYPNNTDLKHFPWLFAKIVVGYNGKRPFSYRTEPVKNVKCAILGKKCCPNFQKETITFDFVDTAKLVDDEKEEIIMRLELWEERMPVFPLACDCNKLLGSLHFNLREVLCNPFQPLDDFFVFTDECTTQVDQRIRMQMTFEAARNGLVCFTLLEGKDLPDRAGLLAKFVTGDKQDPYVTVNYGGQKRRSKTCKNGGTAPNFFNEKLYFWTKDLFWQDKLAIKLFDDDVGKDDFIAGCELDLLQYFGVSLDNSNKMRKFCFKKKKKQVKSSSKIKNKSIGDDRHNDGLGDVDLEIGNSDDVDLEENSDDEEGGCLVAKVDFFPAGKLTIVLKSGRNLRNTELVGKMDPYVIFEVGKDVKQSKGGEMAYQKHKSKVNKNGGINPVFNQSFEFDIVDQHEVKICCFDKDTMGKDDLVGETTYSLMRVFEKGLTNTYIPLSYGKSVDNRRPAGEIQVIMHFDPCPVWGAPTGWHYPCCAVQMETHLPPVVPKTFAGVGAMPPEKSYICPGRFILECVELDDIKGKDKSLEAYVEFKLGKETKKKHKTKTVKCDETGRDVKFTDEVFTFDVTDPNELKQDDDIVLEMGVFDDNWKSDTLLCAASFSILKVMKKAYYCQDKWLDLKVAGDDDMNGRIRLRMTFEPAKVGLIRVLLNSATNLKDGGMLDVDKNDAYVQMSIADDKTRSITCDDAGKNADWNNQELLLWVDGKNWVNPLKFECFDQNMLRDSTLGSCELSLTKLMGPAYLPMLSVDVRIPLFGVSHDVLQNEKERNCIVKSLAELLDEEEDNIEDVKILDRPSQPERKRAEGCDITFTLCKELVKGMNINGAQLTKEEWTKSVNKLWKYKKYETDKAKKQFDPKPRELLKRLNFIVKEGDLLNSFQGRMMSQAAKLKVLSLGGLIVDRDGYEKPSLRIDNMRSYDLLMKGKVQKTDPELHMDVSFYPAGILVVEIIEGMDFRKTEWFGKTDNYVVMTAKSRCCNIVRKTDVIKGGGSDCKFDSEFSIDVCDCTAISMEVFDDDIGKDDLIGTVEIDLRDVYRKGVVDKNYELKFRKRIGGSLGICGGKFVEQRAGELRVRMSFFAGSIAGDVDDVMYPVEVDLAEGEVKFDAGGNLAKHLCFDESERINVLEKRDRGRRNSRTSRELVVSGEVTNAIVNEVKKETRDDASVASSIGSKQANKLILAPLDNAPPLALPLPQELVGNLMQGEESARLETDSELNQIGRKLDGTLMDIPEEDDDDGKIIRPYSAEEQVKMPISIDYIAMQRILTRVQDEVESKKEDHEAALRKLFKAWHPQLHKYHALTKQIDEARTVVAYKQFMKDRKKQQKKVSEAKKTFIEGLILLEDEAMSSEDFVIVALVRKELRETRDRVKERHYRTLSEERLYVAERVVKSFFQYIIAIVWAAITFPFFVFLFCFGFVFSGDVDMSNDSWHGEDLEASTATICFPCMCGFSFPGYILDIQSHLFGREGSKKHWIWNKVFRPRNFDEQLMKKLFEIQDKKDKEEDADQQRKDQEVDLDELKAEAIGGVKKFAAGVDKEKQAKTKRG